MRVSQFANAVIIFVMMSSASAFADDDPLRGYWGGENISIFATQSGVDGNFHCSFGRILEPIYLDEDNQFSVVGFVDLYEGGSEATRIPATFSGVVKKKQMQMQIVLKNGRVWIFNLKKGDLGKVKKCD